MVVTDVKLFSRFNQIKEDDYVKAYQSYGTFNSKEKKLDTHYELTLCVAFRCSN